ncbi:MAG: type IV toxin-antitoxin system AbiEi family antitoxin domain-containing protein [Nocardioides sp.]|uniref:type IV toxin-antitoxin system AbiEi family antitoxin domain-containing protein n=1 Tax=Nocardioides sp. TaxID=35761 RepID=UPI003D6C0896
MKSLPATFTTRAALQAGVHPRDLYHWRDDGEVIELSRGVFRHADAPEPSLPELLAVGMRAPEAIVCCVSAAVAHGLTDEMEPAVQIAVSSARSAPRIVYPPTSVFRFDAETFEVGLSQVEAAPGEFVRIYDPA